MDLRLTIPCPFNGTDYYLHCDKALQIITFKYESIKFLVFGCQHMDRVDARELVGEAYCSIAACKSVQSNFATAGRYGVCQAYMWEFCIDCGVSLTPGYDCENGCTELRVMRKNGLIRKCDVCGADCYSFRSAFAIGRDKYKIMSRLLSNEICNLCSPKCCSLALKAISRTEREKRKTLKELTCVREAKRLLAKFKKEMQNGQNPEVLRSLREEFARAATSL